MRISGVHTGTRCSKQLVLNGEVNRLKTDAFTFGFETLPHRLVCVTSLFLSVISLHVINEI